VCDAKVNVLSYVLVEILGSSRNQTCVVRHLLRRLHQRVVSVLHIISIIIECDDGYRKCKCDAKL
jgi:HEPN domain-containing protein